MNSAPKLKNPIYELFIVSVSLLALVNAVLKLVFNQPLVITVISLIDVILSFIFLLDFFYRLKSAPSKADYFLRQYGWADLLASTPQPYFKILRLFRILKALRLVRAYGGRRLARNFALHTSSGALLIVLFLILLVLEFGSVGIVFAEVNSPNANITSAADALWWVYVTITTVGYGDRYPTTNAGRLIGALVMALGVGLFSVLTGYLANAFLAPKRGGARNADREADRKTDSGAPVSPGGADDPRARLAELKTLLAEQQRLQRRLEAKIDELEYLIGGTRP